MKAIHNECTNFSKAKGGVVSISKIGKMKAIHNGPLSFYHYDRVL